MGEIRGEGEVRVGERKERRGTEREKGRKSSFVNLDEGQNGGEQRERMEMESTWNRRYF